MREDIRTFIDQAVQDALQTLFEGLDIRVEIAEHSASEELLDLAASVGFTGTNLRGALVLVTQHTFAEAARPPELRDRKASVHEIADWVGELANQTLGRIKNRLVSHGVVLEISTPSIVIGRHLHHPPARITHSSQFIVRNAVGSLIAYFDAHADAGFTINLEVNAADQAMPEGELALF